MQTPNIQTTKQILPMIYAYATPDNLKKQGWFKVGYTEQDVDKRIRQQTHTAGITPKKLWAYVARFNDGLYFNDHAFHAYLTRKGIAREKGTEWFDFKGDVRKSIECYKSFTFREDVEEAIGTAHATPYTLRAEQQQAVDQTKAYFEEHRTQPASYLWNAKPRFGKTLATYDLIQAMGLNNVLVLTNRPAVANSWVEDYERFVKYSNDNKYRFVSDSPVTKDLDVMRRSDFVNERLKDESLQQIAFESLQGLKGSVYFGGPENKLKWIADVKWDMVVIDEAHEGAGTSKADFAFDQLNTDYTLHLSGTPFKQLSSDQFHEDQIFNWSYMDEQEAKATWDETATDTHNPYAELPTLNMYTYQMSHMIMDQVRQGAAIGDDVNVDYAFDLNEFFQTNNSGKFVYEEAVSKWLDSLTTSEKYPFSTPELRDELKHTMWLLERVDSVKALVTLLRKHPVFSEYAIVSVAGDGHIQSIDGVDIEQEAVPETGRNKALDRVKEAIRKNDKTITLTVGQLTTGVTVPEWSAVLMLSNIQSPALYMQAGFRAQNPYQWDEQNELGEITTFRKTNAYIFDFSPDRTLDIVDQFANNLSHSTADGTGSFDERQRNIKRLLNFFPVIGEDEDGRMVELDARQVLTLPNRIKSREVVKRGFMSNLLFSNISAIFQSKEVVDILNKFEKTEQGRLKTAKDDVRQEDVADVDVDDQGNVVIDRNDVIEEKERIFGDKVYAIEEIEQIVDPDDDAELTTGTLKDKLFDASIRAIQPGLEKMRVEKGLTKAEVKRVEQDAKRKAEHAAENFEKTIRIKEQEYKHELSELREASVSEEDYAVIETMEKEEQERFKKESVQQFSDELTTIMDELSTSIIEHHEEEVQEKKKKTVEDDVRANLRGFARAIPSFIMAYGNEHLTLRTFDEYVDAIVFLEVTGVTLDEFIFLRDGGSYTDSEGNEQQFAGQLFNEQVFNESIHEFLRKKSELSNYFDDLEESIYDYVPPQNTNQIYTPQWVAAKMVQDLEDENPGIFNDPNKTYIDLYMKSGIYITELVKKLYNSEGLIAAFPDSHARLTHILENQVYGLAPTEIIYRISTNYIFGDATKGINHKNFKCLDAYPYAAEGTLSEKLDEVFN